MRNLLQSALLLSGMLGLLSLCVWAVFGPEGALWALGGWVVALLLSPRASPALVLRMYRGRELGPGDAAQSSGAMRRYREDKVKDINQEETTQ